MTFTSHYKPFAMPRAVHLEGQGGVDICMWDYGGPGRPLLMLHPTGTHARIWEPVIQRLQGEYRVFAPDARGHGDSGKPADFDAYRWQLSGFDLLEAVDDLDLGENLIAVGHSFGATQIVHAELNRPGLFERAVLIEAIMGPADFYRAPDNLKMLEASRRRKMDFASRAEARERFASKPPMQSWSADVLDAYLEHGMEDLPDDTVRLKCPGTIEAAFYDRGGGADAFERLDEIGTYCLLLAGEKSSTRRLVELQHERIARNELMVIEGAGHFVPQEQPDTIAQWIDKWFLS